MNTFHTAIHIALQLKREYHRNEWDNRTHNEFGGGTKKSIYQKNSGTNYCKTNNVHGKTFATNWTCIHVVVVSHYFIPFWFIFCGWRDTLKFIFLSLYHAMTNRNRQEKRARKEQERKKKTELRIIRIEPTDCLNRGKKAIGLLSGPQAYSIGILPSVKLANLAI